MRTSTAVHVHLKVCTFHYPPMQNDNVKWPKFCVVRTQSFPPVSRFKWDMTVERFWLLQVPRIFTFSYAYVYPYLPPPPRPLLTHNENTISDEEFAFLYDCFLSKNPDFWVLRSIWLRWYVLSWLQSGIPNRKGCSLPTCRCFTNSSGD